MDAKTILIISPNLDLSLVNDYVLYHSMGLAFDLRFYTAPLDSSRPATGKIWFEINRNK